MHWLLWTLLLDGCLAVAALFSRKAHYYRRLIHFTVCVVIASVTGIVSSPVLWAVGRRASCNWVVARTFYFLTHLLLGIRVEIEGEEIMEQAGPCVLVGNHQSVLDLVMLGRVFPMQTVILAKKSLSYYPLLGWFMRLADDIFISRGSRQSASDMFKQASRVLLSKRISVWFFPEGTRGRFDDGPGLLPFKQGAFLLAYHAKVPIVPVVVMDIHNIYDKRSFWSAPGTMRVKVLAPISVDGMREDELKGLMEDTRARMLEELHKISPARERH
ncbi:1-acylglycerol-3-phosphate O-acyltransferase [Coemansia sp. RSA 2607]|nr:1-acylglycerol-3-phosphate O-acyltransferase [Coemansia sp. RSA 2607]KAJ2385377.1 1-acylglycerol-3-phosphate O-acyltransferase [Coemansia sp. RSA 2603]